MSVVLELKNITKTYTQGRLKVNALRGVNLKVYEGDFIAILGPSGSGKTTLMNILGCLDKASSGEFLLNGKNVTTLSKIELIEYRQQIGFVFQRYNLIQRLNILENVEISLLINNEKIKEEREQKCKIVLEHLGLSKRITHTPNELSGGQQQRVAIARALVRKPKFLLLDEPTGNVDTQNRDQLMKLIKKLNTTKKITIILITHDLKVADLANHICYIVDGRLVSKEEFEKPLVFGKN